MPLFTEISQYYRFTTKQLLFWLVAWSVLGVILAQTEIADATRSGSQVRAWEPWCWAFSASYAYALISPFIVFCCHRWPFERQHHTSTLVKLILLYAPVTFVFINLMFALRQIVYLAVIGEGYGLGDLTSRYIYEFPKTLSVYFLVVFVTYTRIFQQKSHQDQLQSAKLHGELMDARLAALRNQLQPHFLFNTLNLISSTMYQDVDKADSIVARLGDLLRYSLATAQKPMVSFQEEFRAMTSYLEIAELRFGDRLKTRINIDNEVMPVHIPAMLLQPLLENSVKYGIEASDNGGTITLNARVVHGQLEIEIINTLHQPSRHHHSFGIGLENTQQRLHYLYQDRAALTLSTDTGDQATLMLMLPIDQQQQTEQHAT